MGRVVSFCLYNFGIGVLLGLALGPVPYSAADAALVALAGHAAAISVIVMQTR
jgi:hypothetical protein